MLPVPQRRPTQLEVPPPGIRCPACWEPHETKPKMVSVCGRCFALIVCLVPGQLQRLVPTDVPRLSTESRRVVFEHRMRLIVAASDRWRAR